jgi:hypothetical protein
MGVGAPVVWILPLPILLQTNFVLGHHEPCVTSSSQYPPSHAAKGVVLAFSCNRFPDNKLWISNVLRWYTDNIHAGMGLEPT